MTHFVNTTDKVYSPGTLNMRFSSQILGSEDCLDKGYTIRTTDGKSINSGTLLYNGSDTSTDKHIYKMQVGDEFKVDLIVMEKTFFDTLIGTVTGRGVPPMKLISSSSGIVLNAKYDW